METLKIKIEGIAPLLMHNGDLANRRNPYVQEMKRINAKKLKRTEDDYDRLERLEWEGGLWLHEGKPCLPPDAIHAMLIEGAKKTRSGKQAAAGVWCDDPAMLVYKGPKTVDELYADHSFVDTRGVRVQRARIMRTRPIFRDWSATVSITYDPKQVDPSDVREWLVTAGEQVGIGDYHPRFGRFVAA